MTDLIIDRTLELQIEEDLPIFVIPIPNAKWSRFIAEENRRKQEQQRRR
jgi:hypothetical protein